MNVHKFGLMIIGQTPRKDSVAFVHNWFKSQGLELEIVERGVLDGLSQDQLEVMAGPAYNPEIIQYSTDTRCGATCHCDEGYMDDIGAGWKEYWIPRKVFNARIQECINTLEAEGVECILVTVGLRYPPDHFYSKVPVIFPWKCLSYYIRMLAETVPNPRVGVVNGNGRAMERDFEMWTDNEWSRDIIWHFNLNNDEEYDKQLIGKLDLVVVQYYNCMDLKDGKVSSEESYFLKLEKKFRCPVISATAAALLFARAFVRPPIDEKKLYIPL